MPESVCDRCGGPNPRNWHAPSPLWDAVMRAPGVEEIGFCCPSCFVIVASERGFDSTQWHLAIDRIDLDAIWTDSDGRHWNPATCLWEPIPDPALLPDPVCDHEDALLSAPLVSDGSRECGWCGATIHPAPVALLPDEGAVRAERDALKRWMAACLRVEDVDVLLAATFYAYDAAEGRAEAAEARSASLVSAARALEAEIRGAATLYDSIARNVANGWTFGDSGKPVDVGYLRTEADRLRAMLIPPASSGSQS